MKEQLIYEVLHHLPSYSSEQLSEIKQAIKIVLCNYDVSLKETSIQTVDDSSTYYLNVYCESCLQTGLSHGSIAQYKFHISKLLFFLNKSLEQISEDDILLYFSAYKKQRTISNGYLDHIRIIFNGFFKWLVKKKIITVNPISAVDPIKHQQTIKKPYSAEEVELLRSSCNTERDLSIVECLYSSAVRASELINLNRADISFAEDGIIVLGKGNKERITYINAKSHIHLQRYLHSRTDSNEALFVSSLSPHNRLTRRGLEDIIKRIGTTANVEKVHPHRFRRTSATDLLNAGMPIEQVQELLGHKSIETTRIYCTVNQEAVKHNHKRYMNF